jgi:hypothetical protein
MSDAHLATLILTAPFLALCAGGLVAQYFAIRAEIARLKSLRVVARREGERS